jgi:hypothetical protein
MTHPVAGSGGITELPNPDGRLSRVHLLLSGMQLRKPDGLL